MPSKTTLKRARKDKREGKVPSTQAGEFVREEVALGVGTQVGALTGLSVVGCQLLVVNVTTDNRSPTTAVER
jgi:hypothetical protein